MTDIYFSHSTIINNTLLEKKCIDIISKSFPQSTIIDTKIPQYIKEELNKLKLERKQIEMWLNQNYFFPLIDKSDIFVYIFNKDNKPIKGSNSIGTKGELNYALSKNKIIYKLINNNNIEIVKMDNEHFKILYNKMKCNRNNWTLKTIHDYQKFYENNPEAVKLILSQFKNFNINNTLYKQPAIPHISTLWNTNNHKKEFSIEKCSIHNTKHAFINTSSQITEHYCPYYNTSWLKPSYGKIKLSSIDEYNIQELITSSRVIHKSFWIFSHDSFEFGGFCLKDNNGNIIYKKDGKPLEDLTKIIGSEPVFDIDIKSEVKEIGGKFFDPDIFTEYPTVINSLQSFISEELCGIDYKMGFSGNGIYFILEPILFSEFEIDFSTFSKSWNDWILEFQKSIENKGIKNIRMELKYGWNRYFKVMGTFHASKERCAIPLNKDEELNYKWLNEITSIQSGLEGNIYREIIKRAGNRWRI